MSIGGRVDLIAVIDEQVLEAGADGQVVFDDEET